MDIGEYEEHPKGVYAICDLCGNYAVGRYGNQKLCKRHMRERKGEKDV